MRILFLGDIVGRPGRTAVLGAVNKLRSELRLDLIVANGENGSGGVGLTAKSAGDLLAGGVDCLTSGNHIWKHKDTGPFLDREERIVRPANYPPGAPGRGWTVVRTSSGEPVALINLLGRTFVDNTVDCPFRTAQAVLGQIPADVRIRIVDFHAEATSEKKAMGYFLDGLDGMAGPVGTVTAVLGTHTHIQTSDAQLLPGGTAYLTDVGMCGPSVSILGVDAGVIVKRFLSGLPQRFDVAEGPTELQGVILEADPATGRAVSIQAWTSEAR